MMVSIRKHLRKPITHIALALADLKVGKSSAVSIAETLDCLKKSLKHAKSGCSSLIRSLHELNTGALKEHYK